MDGASLDSQRESLPEAFSAALAEQARIDAEIVGQWLLANVGDSATQGILAREFILGVGLSLKLCQWEIRGVHAHLDAGLPSGPQLLVTAFQLQAGSALADIVASVGARIAQISFEEFAWSIADTELTPFALAMQTDAGDEKLLDAVADFLANCEGVCR